MTHQVELTITVSVADLDATMALAEDIAMEQEGWEYPPRELADAVALIINCGWSVGYLRYFAEQTPNFQRGGWVADNRLT